MMNRNTGERMGLHAHLHQSVADILATPIGSRVMRREYGSLVPALIDQPDNLATQTRVFAAIASALMRWEPRLQLAKLAAIRHPERPGRVDIELTCTYVGAMGREPAPLSLTVPLTRAQTQGGAA